MRIALAQLNPVVGDFDGNAKRILEAMRRAEERAVELVLTPELSLWGYPPRDQLLEPSRIQQQNTVCLLYTSPSPRDMRRSRMPSSA